LAGSASVGAHRRRVCVALQIRDVLLDAKLCHLKVHRLPPWVDCAAMQAHGRSVGDPPSVGCLDTLNWVPVDRLRGLGVGALRGWKAAETVELGTIYLVGLVGLVGSTQMATSVGPVRWDEMREQFFGLLREAIAASEGREFKNTGDRLMVAFASASAAVGCAVLTEQVFERRYRGAEQRLRVRIGLGTPRKEQA